MTLTAIVGALVALLPAVKRALDKTDPRFVAGYDAGLNDGRLEAENLERDLSIQRQLVDHWQGQARILAQALRREREGRAHEAPRQMAYAQWQSSQAAARDQQFAIQQQYGAQQNGLAFEGLCNCVPSRAQVWGAQAHGLVGQLNDLGE